MDECQRPPPGPHLHLICLVYELIYLFLSLSKLFLQFRKEIGQSLSEKFHTQCMFGSRGRYVKITVVYVNEDNQFHLPRY